MLPAGSEKAQLLDPRQTVPDPIGCSLEVYRETRDHIAVAVSARMAEMLALVEAR